MRLPRRPAHGRKAIAMMRYPEAGTGEKKHDKGQPAGANTQESGQLREMTSPTRSDVRDG